MWFPIIVFFFDKRLYNTKKILFIVLVKIWKNIYNFDFFDYLTQPNNVLDDVLCTRMLTLPCSKGRRVDGTFSKKKEVNFNKKWERK